MMILLLPRQKLYLKMVLVRNDDSKTIRCSRCNASFKDEAAAEIHDLTHEVVSLRQSLDQKLESLERTVRYDFSLSATRNRNGSF